MIGIGHMRIERGMAGRCGDGDGGKRKTHEQADHRGHNNRKPIWLRQSLALLAASERIASIKVSGRNGLARIGASGATARIASVSL